jgi:GNAT superfamily N-acetyltransferase
MRRSPSPTGRSGSRRPSRRIEVRPAAGRRELGLARRLIEEYVRSLEIDLRFQGIDHELGSFPGSYAPPRGRLLVARVGGRPAGCVAVRAFSARTCEMKRLYVRPRFRGVGVGRRLAVASLRAARSAGYRRMRLDTLGSMAAAMTLYRSLGFREIGPYRYNPEPGARYFELELTGAGPP